MGYPEIPTRIPRPPIDHGYNISTLKYPLNFDDWALLHGGESTTVELLCPIFADHSFTVVPGATMAELSAKVHAHNRENHAEEMPSPR